MTTPVPGSNPDPPAESAAPPEPVRPPTRHPKSGRRTNPVAPEEPPLPPTPWRWRVAIGAGVVAVGLAAHALHHTLGYRVQAGAGILCFLGIAAAASGSLQSVRLKTLLWGIGLQFTLAVAVIHSEWVQAGFKTVGGGIGHLLNASDAGARFVFGRLADRDAMDRVFGPDNGFVFAFRALPPIIFVSSFFSVLYHLGVLQLLVRLMARVMMYLMGTSGAETLSVAANVFMGQTEAPLIVKPFVPRMTRSELLALMGSGMAHISGGMMAVYISYGADPVAILCTCVMACPCSLYLAKLVYPEAGTPETTGNSPIHAPSQYVNVIHAASGGVKIGLKLALNVAAMLIGFLAFLALFDLILSGIKPGLIRNGLPAESIGWWPDDLKLQTVFGWVFAPVAFLLGVDPAETGKVGSLLGIKLAANEHVAYVTLTKNPDFAGLSDRSRLLAVFALTGFANFASVGIQLGGIGSIARSRQADLAKLWKKALFVGFLATLINAAVAGVLM
ncbi:MAG: Na+ dependent nucleoside transporter domain protein [Gemmataceae bacterium]|nr:Na+ dependent nucleoside transporter domain protein [Gemmataceae bacterium]